MKLLKHILLLSLVFALLACNKSDDPEPPKPCAQTVIVFMPWADMTTYFKRNISDFENFVNTGNLDNQRVIVCIAYNSKRAGVVELSQNRRDTLFNYENPDFTLEKDLSQMLTDIIAAAPAERYALIIGGHGTGWLPKGASLDKPKLLAKTRYFGGQKDGYQIEIQTLATAIQNSGRRMEYILFDGCYMSNIETAYELKDVADYIIGSPTEIMIDGFPYADCAKYLFGNVDFDGLCRCFVDFYNNYSTPCGTIAVTDCRRLDDLAQTVRKINLSQEFDEAALSSTQKMDGYNPTVFYDFGDYFLHQCTDEDLSAELLQQLAAAVPYKAHTECYFSAVNGSHHINHYSGITISAPTDVFIRLGLKETKWWRATE